MDDGLLTDGEFPGGAICGWIKNTTGDASAKGGLSGGYLVQNGFLSCSLSFFLYLVRSLSLSLFDFVRYGQIECSNSCSGPIDKTR